MCQPTKIRLCKREGLVMANRVKSTPRTIQPSVGSWRLPFVMTPAPSSPTYNATKENAEAPHLRLLMHYSCRLGGGKLLHELSAHTAYRVNSFPWTITIHRPVSASTRRGGGLMMEGVGGAGVMGAEAVDGRPRSSHRWKPRPTMPRPPRPIRVLT